MRLANFLDSCMFQWDSVAVVYEDGEDMRRAEHFVRDERIPNRLSECYVQAWDVDSKMIVAVI